MNNGKIDVIIPIYNTEDIFLKRCLTSVANQVNVNDITVIIVDDGSDREYEEIIDKFRFLLDIKFFKLKKNSGPGIARQYGMDHSFNEFITFLDSDDTLKDSFSLSVLKKGIKTNYIIRGISETYIEEEEFYKIYSREKITDLKGTLFRRNFITQNHIRFNPERHLLEDVTFCFLSYLLANDNIVFINTKVYLSYHMKKEFEKIKLAKDLIQNYLYIYKILINKNIPDSYIIENFIFKIFFNLYNLFYQIKEEDNIEEIFSDYILFYKEVIKKYDNTFLFKKSILELNSQENKDYPIKQFLKDIKN